MEIQNKETRKKYTMSRSDWEKLGKNQRLFTVTNETDEAEVKPQIIDNTVKPGTGQKVIVKDEQKNKHDQTKKK